MDESNPKTDPPRSLIALMTAKTQSGSIVLRSVSKLPYRRTISSRTPKPLAHTTAARLRR
jgi:hypothetical protein